MRYIFKLSVSFLFLAGCATLRAQGPTIDPTGQIQWNLSTGSGSPGSNGINCTQNGNYSTFPYGAQWGQTYTDTTGGAQYFCTASGWVANSLPAGCSVAFPVACGGTGSTTTQGALNNLTPGNAITAASAAVTGALPYNFTTINTWCDSLCYGQQDGSTTTVCTELATDTGLPCNNYGYTGQTSLNIAVRMGAITNSATVTGNTIPSCATSGSCSSVGISFSPTTQNPANTDGQQLLGTLCGVVGNLHYTSSYQFTPSFAGSSVSCGPGALWTPQNTPTPNSLNVIWAGTNDFNGNAYPSTASNVQTMVAYIQGGCGGLCAGATYLVIPPQREDSSDQWPSGVYGSDFTAIIQAESAANPSNFLDVLDWLAGQGNRTICANATPCNWPDYQSYYNGVTPASLRAAHTPFATLNGAIADTVSCSIPLTISNVNNFPLDNNQTLTVDSEQILVKTHTGPTVNTCVRGYNYTTAATHLLAATVNEIDGVHLSGPTYAAVGDLINQWAIQNPEPTSNWVFGLSQLTAQKTSTQNSSAGIFGYGVLQRQFTFNTNAVQNTSLSPGALEQILSGNNNVAAGYEALYNFTGGNGNTGIGALSLFNATGVGSLTSVGFQSQYSNGGAGPNDALGNAALYLNVSGTGNAAFGLHVLYHNTGNDNTGFGEGVLPGATTATNNSAFGFQSGGAITTGGNNSMFGFDALLSNLTGTQLSAFGANSLSSATTGPNDAFGYNALAAVISGTGNVGMGNSVLAAELASGSTAVGDAALLNATVGNLTCVGFECLKANVTGIQDTAFGYEAEILTTGNNNDAFGFSALGSNVSGTTNVAFGANSLTSDTASNNAALGSSALRLNTTGAQNTAVGNLAGYTGNSANANVSGSNNTWVGYATGPSSATQYSNSTALGNGALTTASNQFVVGNSSLTQAIIGGNSSSAPTAALYAATLNVAAARVGTFVCTNAGTISISNASVVATSAIVISMNAQGGTITTPPAMKTITAGTGFSVLCGATDTSTYNYDVLN